MRSVAQGVGVSFRWRKKRVEGVVWVGQNTAEELVVIFVADGWDTSIKWLADTPLDSTIDHCLQSISICCRECTPPARRGVGQSGKERCPAHGIESLRLSISC